MAEDGSWESSRKLGLLSTSALLDRFGVGEGRRRRIESARRPEIEAIEHPAAINSGATFAMNPAPRGPDTFRRIEDHPRVKAVVELAVDYAVPGTADLTGRVSRWRGGEELEKIWRKG